MLHVSRLLIPMGLFVSTVVSAQQFLPVRGIVNARDLGGYVMQDGRKVRDGLLLRSAERQSPGRHPCVHFQFPIYQTHIMLLRI